MFESIKQGFLKQVTDTKESKHCTDLYCRDVWHFDAGQMIRNQSAPHLITFLKYCKVADKCPVQFLIFLLKDYIKPDVLIDYIKKLYKLNDAQ